MSTDQLFSQLASDHPHIFAVLVLVAMVRGALKPLFTAWESRLPADKLAQVRALETSLKTSPVGSCIVFGLDYLGSVKLPIILHAIIALLPKDPKVIELTARVAELEAQLAKSSQQQSVQPKINTNYVP